MTFAKLSAWLEAAWIVFLCEPTAANRRRIDRIHRMWDELAKQM